VIVIAVLEEIALPEIADCGAPHPAEELHVERTVKAISLADDLYVGLSRLRPRDRDCEIAREPRQHERQDHDGERDQKAERQPPHDQT
jgi:hypothetical protein